MLVAAVLPGVYFMQAVGVCQQAFGPKLPWEG